MKDDVDINFCKIVSKSDMICRGGKGLLVPRCACLMNIIFLGTLPQVLRFDYK